ncbi:MAG: hypothetical protein M3Y48_20695 [Actinomycetota bacterium]|nr:hypothetical protein [Actinomycetota bacterium]
MSKSQHPRRRPATANGHVAGTRTVPRAAGSALPVAASGKPHATAESANVDLAKPLRLRITFGAVTFLVIGPMILLAAAAPDEPWWERVICVIIGVAAFLFGRYGMLRSWGRRILVVDGAGVRVQLRRRCLFDLPWQDLSFVEVVQRPGGYSLSMPSMVWLDFYPGPDFTTRHPKQARLCKRHPTGQAYRFQLGPVSKIIPKLDEAFQSVHPEQYRGVREQSWSQTPKFTWRLR